VQAAPPQTSPTSSVRRRVAAVVAVSAGSVAFILLWGLDRNFFDLKIYMRAMDWWAAGNPLYDYVQPDRVQGELYFTYPPLSALLLRPFGALPLGLTIAIFTVFTAAAIALTTWWLIKPVAERRDLPLWYAAGLAIPLALLVEPSRETISFGQINMVLVVLILADLLFAVPRNSRWAGVGIGLATALKLFPGIFIVYLIVTRRWRAAAVSAATAAGATLLAAAIFPGDSWRFWTVELWSTERVGRLDYTGNQSLQGMIARLVAPDQPPKLAWLLVAVAVAAFGLWRAARASREGDNVAALTLTGLVGALISPITWPHHVYWFIPALIVLIDAGGRRNYWLFGITLTVMIFGVNTFIDWGEGADPTHDPGTFLLRNLYVLLMLVLLVLLPARPIPEHAPNGQT
jgi:alpha-1,2-mannosyltransferase